MKLIDEAHNWYKLWSVRLAALAGLTAAYLAANPDQAQAVIDSVPEAFRPLASIALGLFVFGLATGARLVKQTPKGE